MKPWTLLVLFVVISGIGAGYLVLKSGRNVVLSPDDTYKPLAIAAMRIGHNGAVDSIEFQNEYPGTHMIAVVVENPPAIGQDFSLAPFRASLVVRSDATVLLRKTVTSHTYPFWNHDGTYSGLALLNYEAPQELPIGEKLSLTVSVLEGGLNLERYGRAQLLVAKVSDK